MSLRVLRVQFAACVQPRGGDDGRVRAAGDRQPGHAGVHDPRDLERDQARAESDVEQVRERSTKDQQLLDSGAISDPKQLVNLQHELNGKSSHWPIPEECFENIESLGKEFERASLVYWGSSPAGVEKLDWGATPQTAIRKNFVMLANQMRNNEKKEIQNIIFFDSRGQYERLFRIFQDLEHKVPFHPVFVSIHEGFIDAGTGISVFTDHQLFERYHRYRLKNFKLKSRALTLKELKNLQRGDLVVHIDHGIGRYDGLEKLDVQGKLQEAVRLLYRDNDLLYVSISSLHKISKYSGSENADPKLNKLGSDAWEKLKTKTKVLQRNHSFTFVFDNFYINSPFGYS